MISIKILLSNNHIYIHHYFSLKVFLCIVIQKIVIELKPNHRTYNKTSKKTKMKKRFLRLLFLSGTVLALLTACEYDYNAPAPPKPAPPAGDTISYSQDIQPFWDAKCVSCHAGSVPPNLLPAVSYLEVVPYLIPNNPETSELYTVCQPGGSMAVYGKVTTVELDLLYRWIYAGAKND
jgi:hypothetical protein